MEKTIKGKTMEQSDKQIICKFAYELAMNVATDELAKSDTDQFTRVELLKKIAKKFEVAEWFLYEHTKYFVQGVIERIGGRLYMNYNGDIIRVVIRPVIVNKITEYYKGTEIE